MQTNVLGGSFSKLMKVSEPSCCSEVNPGFLALFRPSDPNGAHLLLQAACPPMGSLCLNTEIDLTAKQIKLTRFSANTFATVKLRSSMTFWDLFIEAKNVLVAETGNTKNPTMLRLVVGVDDITEDWFQKPVRSYFNKVGPKKNPISAAPRQAPIPNRDPRQTPVPSRRPRKTPVPRRRWPSALPRSEALLTKLQLPCDRAFERGRPRSMYSVAL